MSQPILNSHSLAQRRVDAAAAVLIAGSSLLFVIAAGHGIGMLWMFVLDSYGRGPFYILFTPWGWHLWIGIALLLSSLLPRGIRLGLRWLAIAASLCGIAWFYSVTEWKIGLVVSALPNILICLLLAAATVIAHRKRAPRL